MKYVSGNFFEPRDDDEDVTIVNAALSTWSPSAHWAADLRHRSRS